MNNKIIFFVLFAVLTFNLQAKTLAGVSLSDEAAVAGETLKLNGAGIRTKFVFDIYVDYHEMCENMFWDIGKYYF